VSILIDLLERSFEKYKENNVIYYHSENYSYERIEEAINRLAQGLLAKGIGKGDRVVILLPNLVQFPAAYYSILKIGAVVVPLNFLFSEEELEKQILQIKPTALIVEGNFLNKVLRIANNENIHLIVLGERIPPKCIHFTKLIATSKATAPRVEIRNEDTALIVFTAGNSGEPKPVELSHEALAMNCQAFRNAFMINSADNFVAAMPLFLAVSQTILLNSAFIAGARIILHPMFNPKALAELIKTQQATVLLGNAALYHSFLDEAIQPEDLMGLKYCIAYGDIFNREIYNRFEEKFGPKLFESYGLCEATSLVTLNRTNGERRKGSVGLPIENVYIKIVDNHNNLLNENEIGEILVQGPSLMKAYPGLPEETMAAIPDGWLRTGDLGKIDELGYLYIIERKQNVILKDGFYVFPKEIESHLLTHPNIKEVSVIGVPEEIHGEEVKACVILQPETNVTAEEIIDYCRQRLEVYKCPKYVQFLQALPKSPTGRILKYRLKEN